MEQFDNTVTGALSFIDNNQYLSASLTLFLVLYAGYAAPKLPEFVLDLFDNPIVKLVVFFLVAYSAKKNPTVAIIAAIGLMVTLHTVSRVKLNRRLLEYVDRAETAMGFEDGLVQLEPDVQVMPPSVEGLEMESVVMAEDVIPEGALAELQFETASHGAPIEMAMEPPAGHEAGSMPACAKRADFKDNFYPQYVDMTTGGYDARVNAGEVDGYDSTAAYASI
jgi:hypothetical protein